jgi:hypothetical protein
MAFSCGSERKSTLSDERQRGVCAYSLLLYHMKKPLVNSSEEYEAYETYPNQCFLQRHPADFIKDSIIFPIP